MSDSTRVDDLNAIADDLASVAMDVENPSFKRELLRTAQDTAKHAVYAEQEADDD